MVSPVLLSEWAIVSSKFEQEAIQRVLWDCPVKSANFYIPVNHHYLEYDNPQTTIELEHGAKDYNAFMLSV